MRRGGFEYRDGLSQPACQALCDAASCSCFDWRDPQPSKPHPSPAQPGCMLTNASAEVKASHYGYAAFVSTTAPAPAPSPGPGPRPGPGPPPRFDPAINYGCRGPPSKSLKFCDTSLGIEARLDALVAEMSIDEKASQLQARSSPPIDRLGIPFFCWGQNAVNGLGAASGFPIAPGMAASFNMSAVKRMGQAIGHNARKGFNERASNHSHGYSCPGSIVTWGATINLIRDPRWGRNFEVPSEDPYGILGCSPPSSRPRCSTIRFPVLPFFPVFVLSHSLSVSRLLPASMLLTSTTLRRSGTGPAVAFIILTGI